MFDKNNSIGQLIKFHIKTTKRKLRPVNFRTRSMLLIKFLNPDRNKSVNRFGIRGGFGKNVASFNREGNLIPTSVKKKR